MDADIRDEDGDRRVERVVDTLVGNPNRIRLP
jgi:hypothetical protein